MTDTIIRHCWNHSSLIVINSSHRVGLESTECAHAGEQSLGEGTYSSAWCTDHMEIEWYRINNRVK